MNELPKDSEKEIWLHHNGAGDPLYDFGFSLVNISNEEEIKINRGKIHLDTYKAAMLGCDFEGEYVKNILTGEKLEPCEDGDKYQLRAWQSIRYYAHQMAKDKA